MQLAHHIRWVLKLAVSFPGLVLAILATASLLRAQTPDGSSADASAFASSAESEVSELREGIALEQWKEGHGNGKHWTRSPLMEVEITDPFHQECLSLVRSDALPSGARIAVQVSFYPPPMPSALTFPTLRGQDLIATCLLGSLRIEAEASTPEIGQALEEAMRRKFDEQYGASVGMKGARRWGRGVHSDSSRWTPGAEIVSGYYGKPGLDYNAPGQLVHGPVAFVRARLPVVERLEQEDCCQIRTYHYRSIERTQFQRAIALSGADASLSERMKGLYEQIFRVGDSTAQAGAGDNATWRESSLPILQDWLSALKIAPPEQRAAGLLAADRLLDAAGEAGGIPGWPDSKEQSELQKLGAAFEMNGIGGYYFYTGNFGKQALELDPQGMAAQMVLVGDLARGSCDVAGWGSDLFRRVISEGEGLLAKQIDADTAAQVHFMVGDAYSDIVAIAGGYAGPNGEYNAEQFQREAISARAKALRHYQAGLAVDNTSENAKDAYRQAWYLAAGLLPRERYVCFGD